MEKKIGNPTVVVKDIVNYIIDNNIEYSQVQFGIVDSILSNDYYKIHNLKDNTTELIYTVDWKYDVGDMIIYEYRDFNRLFVIDYNDFNIYLGQSTIFGKSGVYNIKELVNMFDKSLDYGDNTSICSKNIEMTEEVEKKVRKEYTNVIVDMLTPCEDYDTDFNNIRNAMEKLNWTWARKGTFEVPTITEMVECVNSLFESCIKNIKLENSKYSICSTGGFTVEVDIEDVYYPIINISFNLVDRSNIE